MRPALMMVLATPVLAMSLLLIIAERLFGLPHFQSERWAAIRFCSSICSGSTAIRPSTSWCFRRWASYREIIPCFRAPTYLRVYLHGLRYVWRIAYCRIFRLGTPHVRVRASRIYANMMFSFLSFIVAVPSAIKVFNWTATLYRGQISFEAPMLYALGFLGLFTIGGLTGLFLASVPIDVHVTDTYFIVAHFHYIMVGGSVSGVLRWPAFLVAENDR